MKPSTFLISAVCGALLMGSAATALAEEKIVFVDLDRAFNEFFKTKLADEQLREQADEYNEERDTMADKKAKLEEEFMSLREESQNTALSEDVRDQKRNDAEERLMEIRDYESKLRRFDDSRKRQLEVQGRRMRKRLLEEIKSTIQDYARKKGYDAVIDLSARTWMDVEVVLFNDEKVDITTQVLDILNAGKE
ncbi:MAG: OmpH family outer membrane protein [Verrucomicrobia bacterium]|nr:OmpH family outer membrane protein [Verrucomicrobiota bacterium]